MLERVAIFESPFLRHTVLVFCHVRIVALQRVSAIVCLLFISPRAYCGGFSLAKRHFFVENISYFNT